MRINHNLMAMNAHRQLGSNSRAQAKSIEKLSSGYRINRAGDDAAGLAISEKMRAQIRGLNQATRNAQDGISLIQTAEGALAETHDILQRMSELSIQSANGTFDNEVDRKNLQSEVTALKSELDRISKSSNFNGIKLLDGSLGSDMQKVAPNVTVNGDTTAVSVVEQAAPSGASGVSTTWVAFDATVTAEDAAADRVDGVYSIKYNDDKGVEHRIDIKAAAVDGTDDHTVWTAKLDGKELSSATYTGSGADDAGIDAGIKNILKKIEPFNKLFEVESDDAAAFTFQAKTSTSKAEVVEVLDGTATHDDEQPYTKLDSIHRSSRKEGISKGPRVEVNVLFMTGISDGALKKEDLDKGILIVDGEKFAFVKDGSENSADVIKALRDRGVSKDNIVTVANPEIGQITAAEVSAMVDKINNVIGEGTVKTLPADLPTTAAGGKTTATSTTLCFESKWVDKGKGLTLQVGDTSEDYQKITVRVNEMSSKGLDIAHLSVATQEDAAIATGKIKNAINKVSSTRGDLGALQNRLEHTINNLETTTENVTASESRIRDVDMAKEMMNYTKQNILNQAAQAMLAQANQLPQGVLQLLR